MRDDWKDNTVCRFTALVLLAMGCVRTRLACLIYTPSGGVSVTSPYNLLPLYNVPSVGSKLEV